jgi:hypothetical protein
MRVPGFGESNARVCDEDAGQLLRYLHGSALLLVSYHPSHVVHPDTFNHNEHPLLLTNKTAEIHLLWLCPTECLFVKYHDRAGHMKEQKIPCLLVCLELTHTPHRLVLTEPKRHFKGYHACLKTAMVRLAG